MRVGQRNALTDVAGLKVGNAQDEMLKSGVTVVTADAPFVVGVHVMGGAPGTRETDLLAPDRSVEAVDALVLSGGSAFGLAAADGVAAMLRKEGRGFAVGDVTVPIVPAAILFDLLNGGDKGWGKNPYTMLGANAYEAASEEFEIGSAGAGTGALMARYKGGLGTASVVLDDGTTVAALVAANPVGSAVAPDGRLWAAAFEAEGEFGGRGTPAPIGLSRLPLKTDAENASTTIAIVATDAALTKAQATRMAVAAHDGIARAIVPAHTPLDGDLVFAAATGAREPADLPTLCHAAALCLSRAIGRAAWEARPARADLLPCLRTG